MEYGLIGGQLAHSCSPRLHELLAGYSYRLVPLETPEKAREFLLNKEYKGLNVTIPYKRLACQLCDELDEGAKATGTVNTVVNRGGRLYGSNTDISGFGALAHHAGVDFAGRTVLILGTGGTSHTVQAYAQAAGAKELLIASRTPKTGTISYEEAKTRQDVEILVNTTPVGMYPNNDQCPIDPALFPNLKGVLDVVYNPLRTRLVSEAQALGIPAEGGLYMLVAQAAGSVRQFTGRQPHPARVDRVFRQLCFENSNIVLVGMPSCGKSSIGRRLARWMGRPFADADRILEAAEGMTIPKYFENYGEAQFRKCEAFHIARIAAEKGQVIACGGGVVETMENIDALRRNGLVIFIDRPLWGLKTGGHRPLSTSVDALRRMEQRRRPRYEQAADIRVENAAGDFKGAACAAEEAVYAYFGLERPEFKSSGFARAGSLRKNRLSGTARADRSRSRKTRR